MVLTLSGVPTPPPGESASPVAGPHLVSFAPDPNFVERAYDAVKYGEQSASPVVLLHLPGDSARALAFVQYTPNDLRGGWSTDARERLEESIRAVLEPRFADWGSEILALHLETPADLESARGWTEGHPHQVDMTLDQIFFMRPFPEAAGYRTPVAGLYLCGAGCHPGGGVHGMQGRNCASTVREDQKRGSPWVRNQL